jgi:hypothetical protein
MNIITILSTTCEAILRWPKVDLLEAVLKLREKYLMLQDRAQQLEQENTQLKDQLEREKIKSTNKQVNQPPSKQADWE